MWEKLFSAVKYLMLSGELTQRNADEIRELRRRNEEVTLLVERLAFEIQRIKENEAHEREKLLLRLDKEKSEKRLISKGPSKKKR